MITILMIIIFILGYIAIAFEHQIKVDKAASALIIGGLGWALLSIGLLDVINIETVVEKFKDFQNWYSIKNPGKEITELKFLKYELSHHLVDIAEILFFLLGAMTIVELIDAHQGFSIITDKISTNNRVKLLWILSIITFFFSAALDNLTTAIVMAALMPKIIKDKQDLWMFAGIVILSANAGGAWSPIGDVTTIMLWIGGQVSASNIILSVFIPSVVCAVVPLIYLSFKLKGDVTRPKLMSHINKMRLKNLKETLLFTLVYVDYYLFLYLKHLLIFLHLLE